MHHRKLRRLFIFIFFLNIATEIRSEEGKKEINCDVPLTIILPKKRKTNNKIN